MGMRPDFLRIHDSNTAHSPWKIRRGVVAARGNAVREILKEVACSARYRQRSHFLRMRHGDQKSGNNENQTNEKLAPAHTGSPLEIKSDVFTACRCNLLANTTSSRRVFRSQALFL